MMKFLKRVTTALTIGALSVMTLATTDVFADSEKEILTSFEQIEMEESMLSKVLKPLVDADLDAEEIDENLFVDVIVEAKNPALISNVATGDALADYALSANGIKYKNTLLAEQEIIKNKIQKLNFKYDLEFKYSYTGLINAFTVRVQLKDLKSLYKLDGVKGVFISQTYELDDEMVTYSGNGTSTGISEMNGLNIDYHGEGMVAAIIDTGLQVEHEAFSDDYYTYDNPTLTVEKIEEVLADLNAKTAYDSVNETALTAEDLNVGKKVAFVYDYADNDYNVSPDLETLEDYGNGHGTHVAGTVAGNNGDDFKGVAYNAQLAIFKVFSDSDNGASTVDILAAIEDATLLGVDSINMSLGSPSGFSFYDPIVDYENEEMHPIDTVYNAVEEAGISLVVSAGNDYSNAQSSYYGNYGNISNVNIGVVGSPSSYKASLSVASINTLNVPIYYVMNGTKKYYYNEYVIDQNDRTYGNFTEDMVNMYGEGEYQYVYCGLGKQTDFETVGSSVEGKIALIVRGEINFSEKVENAKAAGAIAVIIVNTDDTALAPVIGEVGIPVMAVTYSAGAEIFGSSNDKISVSKSYLKIIPDMSDFSSWGDVNLTLKPEITSPGGEIWSSYPGEENNEYVLMSGTSMAAPNTCGATLVVKQYVKNVLGITDAVEANTRTYQLLMGTANVVEDENGRVYSPRKQGAGLVDLEQAVTTKEYLTVDGTDRVKIELGKDASCTGIYNLAFNIVNTDTVAKEYVAETLVMVPEIALNGISINEFDKIIDDAIIEYSVLGDGSNNENVITVNAGGTLLVEVSITLSKPATDYLDKFTYGAYVEGFVTLTNSLNTLNIPYLGYYGDYDKSHVFDIPSYENGKDGKYVSKDGLQTPTVYFYLDNGTPSLGLLNIEDVVNTWDFKEGYEIEQFDGTKYAFNGSLNNPSLYGIYQYQWSQLKNVDLQQFYIADVLGNGMDGAFDYNYYLNSSCYLPAYGVFNSYTYSNLYQYISLYYSDSIMNNMEIALMMIAQYTGSDGNNYFDMQGRNFYVDQELAQLLESKITQDGDKYYLEVTYYDNHYVQALSLFNSSFTKYYDVAPNAENKGKNVVKIDITDIYPDVEADGTILLGFTDYALNESYYAINLASLAEDTEETIDLGEVTAPTITDESTLFQVNSLDVIVAYDGDLENVYIPEGTAAIGNYVFANDKNIRTVIIPSSVTHIGDKAFYNCENLEYVVFLGDAPTMITSDHVDGYAAYANFTNSQSQYYAFKNVSKSNIETISLSELSYNPGVNASKTTDIIDKQYVIDYYDSIPEKWEVGDEWRIQFGEGLKALVGESNFTTGELATYNVTELNASHVQELINNLKAYKDITLDDEEDINYVREQYDLLTEAEKATIINYEKLDFAETKIAILHDLAAAEAAKEAAEAAQLKAEEAQAKLEEAQAKAEAAKEAAEAAQLKAEEAQAKAEAAQSAAEAEKDNALLAQAAAEAAKEAAEAAKEAAIAEKELAEAAKEAAIAEKELAEIAKEAALQALAAAEDEKEAAEAAQKAAEEAAAAAEAAKKAADESLKQAEEQNAEVKAEADSTITFANNKANTAQLFMILTIVFASITLVGGIVFVFVVIKK